MKILVLSNQDLASCIALNDLLPELRQAQHQLRLLLSAKVGSNKTLPPALETLKHYEQALFIESIFPELEQQETTSEYLSFNQLAKTYCDRPFVIENNINSDASISALADYEPELIISIRYGVILKEPVINLPRLGIINLHSGKLPDYRGVMATFWAMHNGEKNIHATLHWIDTSAIDDGGIIAMTKQRVDYSKSYLENLISLYPDGVQLILNTVAKMSDAKTISTQESLGHDNYYSFPVEDDLEKLRQDGHQLVNESAIQNLINEKFTAS